MQDSSDFEFRPLMLISILVHISIGFMDSLPLAVLFNPGEHILLPFKIVQLAAQFLVTLES
jgi:hypothetical protein